MTGTRSLFFKNLSFWSFHCSFTALPSFLIAGIYLEFFKSLIAVFAMMSGVVIFILGYTCLSTRFPLLHDQGNLFSRALRLALKIRIWVSAVGLFGIIPFVFIFHPDYWAGMAAKLLLESIYNSIWNHAYGYELARSDSFLAILLWTLTEGLILSAFLFFIAFICLSIMRLPRPKVEY